MPDSNKPWISDEEVLPATLEAALRAALPDLEIDTLRLLGSGWDFSAYLVNETWVFRVPRRARFEAGLVREIDLMNRLDGHLPLPVPKYAFGPLSAAPCPVAFGGYRFLPGVALVDLEATPALQTAIASQLGPFLSTLHAFPTDALEGLSPTTYLDKADLPAFRARVGRFLPCVQDGFAPADMAARARRFFEDDVAVPAPFAGTPVLRHTDIHCEHVMVTSRDDFTISAIIDWSDASVGDPAPDLAALLPWAGVSFLDELLSHYRGADEGLRARAQFLGTVVAFAEIAWLRESGREAAAQRMIGPTDELLRIYV